MTEKLLSFPEPPQSLISSLCSAVDRTELRVRLNMVQDNRAYYVVGAAGIALAGLQRGDFKEAERILRMALSFYDDVIQQQDALTLEEKRARERGEI